MDSIKKNTNDFSFIDTLGSFATNAKFRRGYEQFAAGRTNEKTFIWDAISAIGGDCAETIYENVLNYIDNVSNIDLCKIKALKSIMEVTGIDYSLVDDIKDIPLEVLNLLDLLSINKKYLLHSRVFNERFRNELSGTCTSLYEPYSTIDLSASISADVGQTGSTPLSSITEQNRYVDEDKYRQFVYNQYQTLLSGEVFKKYADSENDLNSKYEYIYEYIADDLTATSDPSQVEQASLHDKEMLVTKLKYNVDTAFDAAEIVDRIEQGDDKLDSYSTSQQQVLSAEIAYRQSGYEEYIHQANSRNDKLALNLTRQSYYRTRKVKEYFNFIEGQYSNLLLQDKLASTVATNDSSIEVYDFDSNYFNITDTTQTFLLKKSETGELQIQSTPIDVVAKILTEKTFAIAELREQIKVQMQKIHIKGTFLLLSYLINEYLMKNIGERYTEKLTYDYTNEPLSAIISTAIATGENVKMIEYVDDTEYFNIQTDADTRAKNAKYVNPTYWMEDATLDTQHTRDIPLDQIEQFYMTTLNAKKNTSNLIAFLNSVFNYGANANYIDKKTGEFMCKTPDGQYIDSSSLSTSLSGTYEKNHKLFLRYCGTNIGYNPFYNYKNITHPSYQIHPYLFNFVEASNYVYPIANSFYKAISENYEDEIVNAGIDSYIGKYGNPINLWKEGHHEYSGYSTAYQRDSHTTASSTKENPIIGYEGAFYPPALKAFISSDKAKAKFLSDLTNNTKDSYYYHLNLTSAERTKIADRLDTSYRAISDHAYRYASTYDIFKYAVDVYGNHWILFKKYVDADTVTNPAKSRTRKNALGELWFRPKDHPLAMPAFNFNVEQTTSQIELDTANSYLSSLYATGKLQDPDTGNISGIMDFELDDTKSVMFIAAPYKTGNGVTVDQTKVDRKYTNSSIIITSLSVGYDDAKDVTTYHMARPATETRTVQDHPDDIPNDNMLVNGSGEHEANYCEEFLGFNHFDNYTGMVFMKKLTSGMFSSGGAPHRTWLTVKEYNYKAGQYTYPTVEIPLRFQANGQSPDVLMAGDNQKLNFAYVTTNLYNTTPTVSVVNDVEYSYYGALSVGGDLTNIRGATKYPCSVTAESGTGPGSTPIDGYRNFVNVLNCTMEYQTVQFNKSSVYGLNSDIGYFPAYPSQAGSLHFQDNRSLQGHSQYGVELVGPKHAPAITPVSLNNDKYRYDGRVTEDYREYDIYRQATAEIGSGVTDASIGLRSAGTVHFDVDSYVTDADLANYSVYIYNSQYKVCPIQIAAKLSAIPTTWTSCANYNPADTDYPTAAALVIAGPNLDGNITGNHINGVATVEYSRTDYNSINIRIGRDKGTSFAVPAGQFEVILLNHNKKAYEHYRLFENRDPDLGRITVAEGKGIGFDSAELSTITVNGKYPFRNQSSSQEPADAKAILEFKYSEDDTIISEFPLLKSDVLQPEAISGSIAYTEGTTYYIALDDHNSISMDDVEITRYNNNGTTSKSTLVINTPEYQAVHDKALVLKTLYKIEDGQITMYMNYDNALNTPYLKCVMQDGAPPLITAKVIDTTYLALKPGESGKLDILMNYRIYNTVNGRIQVVGQTERILKSYWVVNASDDRPKLVISRNQFMT